MASRRWRCTGCSERETWPDPRRLLSFQEARREACGWPKVSRIRSSTRSGTTRPSNRATPCPLSLPSSQANARRSLLLTLIENTRYLDSDQSKEIEPSGSAEHSGIGTPLGSACIKRSAVCAAAGTTARAPDASQSSSEHSLTTACRADRATFWSPKSATESSALLTRSEPISLATCASVELALLRCA